ncbi:MAG TPA: SDR family oxidoreductase [Gemmatimonadaceae bacterium]|nr:SDR family oxidoreductase [Gemmatimonadaceae bacterium]
MSETRPASAPTERYLEGRHAVVTGGGRGIGAAIASELARLGASLTLMGRDEEVLRRHVRAVVDEHDVRAEPVRCDVSDERSVEEAFAAARERLGEVHVLVNNAGQAIGGSLSELSRDRWDEVLAVNLTGPFLCARAVLPAMLAAGSGRIVNIASTAGLRGYNKMAAYCASKHGVVGLTRALAMETAKAGVTVNAVCPGYTDTDMAQAAVHNLVRALGKTPEEALAMIVRIIPRRQLTQPQEVASAVGWLCSPHAAAVTGIAIPVAGGEVQ